MQNLDKLTLSQISIYESFVNTYKFNFQSFILIIKNRIQKNQNPQLCFLEQKLHILDPEFNYIIAENSNPKYAFPFISKCISSQHLIILRESIYNGAANHQILCNLFLYLIIASYLSNLVSQN